MAALGTCCDVLLCVQVSDLQYNTLANGHGPIIRYNVEELVEDYKQWSLAVEKGQTQVSQLHSGTDTRAAVTHLKQLAQQS